MCINLNETRSNPHIEKLCEALRNVKECYFSHCFGDNKWEVCNERSFAYELYRQWANLLYTNDKTAPNLVLNAEITKKTQNFEQCSNNNPNEEHLYYPDLVLHKSQWDSEQQELICEIKLSSNSNGILQDLRKLTLYTITEEKGGFLFHPFKIAAFILVNGNFEIIKNAMSESSGLNKNIYCIIYNRGNVEYKKLGEL